MKWIEHRERVFPVELYDDPTGWERALKQFIEEARSQIPTADRIQVMVMGEASEASD